MIDTDTLRRYLDDGPPGERASRLISLRAAIRFLAEHATKWTDPDAPPTLDAQEQLALRQIQLTLSA